MGYSTERNSVYFLRVVMTGVILLFHYLNIRAGIGWHIGVEFFFVVSGYLLWEKLNFVDNGFSFIRERFKRLYPAYLQAIILLILYRICTKEISMIDLFDYVKRHFAEFFMLHLFGSPIKHNFSIINGVGWYVVAMFFATIFYLFLYKCFGKTKWLKYLIVVMILCIYRYSCFYLGGGMNFWAGSRYPNDTFCRAIAGMGVGAILAELKKIQCLKNFVNRHSSVCIIISFAVLGSSLWFTYIWPDTKWDVIILGCLAFVIFIAFHVNTTRFLDNKIVRYLNQISYKVYLNQLIPLNLFLMFFDNEQLFRVEMIFFFLLSAFAFGAIIYETDRCLYRICKLKKCYKEGDTK